MTMQHQFINDGEAALIPGRPGVLYEERTGAQRMYRWVNGAMAEISDGGGGGGSGGYLGSGDETAMLAVTGSGVVVGAWFLRTDVVPSTNYYLDALPASTASNWRAALPADQNAPIATFVAWGGSSFEGNDGSGATLTTASCSRTSNVLTVVHSSVLGTNPCYIGQRVRLSGVLPYDLNTVYEKVTATATGFTAVSIGPDIAAGNITADGTSVPRMRDVQQMSRCSAASWAMVFSHGRMRLLANSAVSGAGWDEAKANLHRDVLSYQPARALVEFGANNLTYVGDPATEAQAVMDKAVPVLDAMRAAGIQIDLCGIKPIGAAAANHVAHNIRAPLVNALYQAYAASNPDQVHYVDTYGAVVSDIGSGELGMAAGLMQTDGVHDRCGGAMRRGQAIANHWASIGAYGRRYHPEPLFGSAPIYVGFRTNTAGGTAGTGASGSIPAGWTLRRDSGVGSVVGSIVARDDGTFGARAEIAAAAGGAGAFSYTLPGFHLYAPKASRWRLVMDFSMVNAIDTGGNLLPPTIWFRSTVNSVDHRIHVFIDQSILPTTGAGVPDCAGRFISNEFQIPNPASGTHTIWQLDLNFGIAGNNPTAGAITFGDIHLIRVG